MTRYPFVADRRKVLWIAVCWSARVFLFAIQWFIYDAARGGADRFRYYVWWSCYTWGILTPVVVYFAYCNPIKRFDLETSGPDASRRELCARRG